MPWSQLHNLQHHVLMQYLLASMHNDRQLAHTSYCGKCNSQGAAASLQKTRRDKQKQGKGGTAHATLSSSPGYYFY